MKILRIRCRLVVVRFESADELGGEGRTKLRIRDFGFKNESMPFEMSEGGLGIHQFPDAAMNLKILGI